MSDKIELNRRRVLGGIATVGAASAALGAGTFAYFSDEQTSSDNTISSGTLSLSVQNDDGTDFSYGFSGLAPGNSGTIEAEIENGGTVDASDIVVETSTATGDDSENLATVLNIDEIRWDGSAITAPADTIDGLTSNNIELDATPANTGTTTLAIDVTFDTGASNDYQDVSVDITHTFTLYQDSNQF